MQALSISLLALALASACQSKERLPAKERHETETEPVVASPRAETTRSPNGKTAAESQAGVPETSPQEPAKVPRKRYVVAALGDSLTDARSGGGYLKVLEARCPESQFLNFGKGADMVNQMRRRFDRDIKPQIQALGLNTLLVYGGVNDLYSDLTAGRKNERIEADLTYIYSSAQEAGLEVVAVTVSPWGGFKRYFNARRGQNTRLLNSWILGQVAGGRVDKAVDSYPLLSCGTPEELCPEYENNAHDGIHLGPQGHTLLGEKIATTAFADCL